MPDTPLRILEQEPPPASSFWLDYRDTWLIALPIYLVVMTLVFIAASAFLVAGRREWRAFALLLAPAAAVALAALLAVANLWVDAGGSEASLSASGAAQVEQGEWYGGQLTGAQATLDVTAEDRVRKVTPLQPHDVVSVSAQIQHPDGRTYDISATQPLVSDPAGRHTTWWGVGVDVWHHGESGIGTDAIPAVLSQVAIFGLGQIALDGEPVAVNVPVHVMTGSGDEFGGRLELDVGDPAALIQGIPDRTLACHLARLHRRCGRRTRRAVRDRRHRPSPASPRRPLDEYRSRAGASPSGYVASKQQRREPPRERGSRCPCAACVSTWNTQGSRPPEDAWPRPELNALTADIPWRRLAPTREATGG